VSEQEGYVYGVGEIVAGASGTDKLCTICGCPVVDTQAHIRFHKGLGHIVEDTT